MTNTQSNQSDMGELKIEDGLSLKLAMMAIGWIAAVSVVAVVGAYYFSQRREQRVIARYTAETNQFVSEHKEQSAALFGPIFDACQNELENARSAQLKGSNYAIQDVSCLSAQAHLAAMNVNQLTDSSAIAYLRVTDGKYSLVEASGKYTGMMPIRDGGYSQLGYGESREDITAYLLDGKEVDMWQDYVYYIQGKEVIVPVSIDGKLVGYIFRGVIEK